MKRMARSNCIRNYKPGQVKCGWRYINRRQIGKTKRKWAISIVIQILELKAPFHSVHMGQICSCLSCMIKTDIQE